ncbi:aminotransferase class I/II-fold pyridoxal phosphate-dependent enzyme [Schaedlerella arabinosiphila]|uniref:Aminotransferase class I/II-fold pyridoxal phosphate-dependent enzyme n=2 Tax=Schaedlerella arabinosiphila TaxID=2044587 RepID=A0A426DIE7_9FIRM|nr:aminotransferase class I/II-fold pyridoxal phosphate-dependent enzyme [Schaedlerella arabinosiphila]
MIPLAMPNLTGNEKKYLENCIDTTYVSSVGEYVKRFESMVAEATGSRYAVATSAGTTGLHAALTAVGVGYDDLVILPTFTFIASANAIRHCGAAPWLMDIESESWCLDPNIVQLEIEKKCEIENGRLKHKKSGCRVAAIMPVYTLGNIPDMDSFRDIADRYNLPLVVDAACAIGAKYKNENFGTLADLSVLSFNGNKTITCGGGGAVVGNDEKLISLLRHITTTARVWPDYDFDMVGFNYRMTNIQAAVGCAQMERLDTFIKRKREVQAFYEEQFKNLPITCFPTTDGSSYWFSGIVLKPGTDLAVAKVLTEKLKKKDIEARTFWKPIHLQKPYKDCPRSNVTLAESVWQRIVTLPCSTNITTEELKWVCNAVKEAI